VVLNKKYELPKGKTRKRKISKKTKLDLPENLYHLLPPSWKYVSIQELYDAYILIDFADGNHGSLYPRKSEFGDEGVIYVTARDISDGRVKWSGCPHLKESKAKELTKGWAKGGDILLTHNATVGRVARVEQEVGDFLLGTSATFFRLNADVLDNDFFYFVLTSPVWQKQLEAVMQQTTRNQVSIQKQAFFQIPFPPINEQRRIVARIGEYISLCDELEARLTQQQTDADRLTESMIASVLEGVST
jgi:type I restriction enzyme S subunit